MSNKLSFQPQESWLCKLITVSNFKQFPCGWEKDNVKKETKENSTVFSGFSVMKVVQVFALSVFYSSVSPFIPVDNVSNLRMSKTTFYFNAHIKPYFTNFYDDVYMLMDSNVNYVI